MMGDAIEREDVGSVHTWAEIWRETKRSDLWKAARGGMGREAMFCSPFVALPRLEFQYLGAHGPHGLRILTPGAFVSGQTQSDSRPPTRVPLPPVYSGPSVGRTVQVSVDCFLFPSYVPS